MNDAIDPIGVALEVVTALDALGIPSTIGGSIASSIAGEPRSTIDIDLVAAIDESHVDALVPALEPAFYVDAEGLRRAVRDRRSTNLIHQQTQIKIDLFVAGGTPIDMQQLQRRRGVEVSGRILHVHPPEDILLQKLRWLTYGLATLVGLAAAPLVGVVRSLLWARPFGLASEEAAERRPPHERAQPASPCTILKEERRKKNVCGSCGKRVLCVFQGAVGAFLASTAPAASTDRGDNDCVNELGHLAESAERVLRLERLSWTCASAGWTVHDIQWEVALRAPVQGGCGHGTAERLTTGRDRQHDTVWVVSGN